MRTLSFKQEAFASRNYYVLDELGQPLFQVHHPFFSNERHIYDMNQKEVATIRQRWGFSLRIELYINQTLVGTFRRGNWFKKEYYLDVNQWQIQGQFWERNYDIFDPNGVHIMHVERPWEFFSDTYQLSIFHDEHMLLGLLIAQALDMVLDNNDAAISASTTY